METNLIKQNAVKHSGKCILLLAMCLLNPGNTWAQTTAQVYDDFEGKRLMHYGERTGVLDTMAKNPAPNSVNSSAKCGLYVRNGAKKFANIKMMLPQNLNGVEAYATYEGIPPALKMKVYTGAPVGTLVEILLGNRNGSNDYPAGVHSQYQAYTTKTNEWEQLEFKFSQIPQGSETSASEINQIVLLFNPNSSNSDTYYFDDLAGPPMLTPTKEEQLTIPEDEVSGKKTAGKEDGKGQTSKKDSDNKTKPK